MKYQHLHEAKPDGWSWRIGRSKERHGFHVYGGTLTIPPSVSREDISYKEWFFRVPLLNLINVITRIRPNDG